MSAEGGRALVPVAFPLVKLRHAPGDFHPPLYLATLSASPTTIVALRTTQTTNQGFVSFAASPNNTLERVTVTPAIRPATSGLIALPSVPPAEQVRLPRSMSGRSSTGVHRLTGWGRVAFKPVSGSPTKAPAAVPTPIAIATLAGRLTAAW